jgi:hypothetical protein
MISAMDKEAFIEAAWPVIGRRVSKAALLADIYETSKLRQAFLCPRTRMRSACSAWFWPRGAADPAAQRHRGTRRRASGRHPDYQLLRSIPGIGPVNALAVLAEAGDLRRFRHHRQFLKFCGMDLATVQSGLFRGRSKISKYGNARLRRTSGSPRRPQC